MFYNWIKIFHVISAVALLGVGIGNLFYLLHSNQIKNMFDRLEAVKQLALVDWLFTGLALLLQPISGFMLIYLKGYVMSSLWWLITLMGYCLAGIAWLISIYIRTKYESLLSIIVEKADSLVLKQCRRCVYMRLTWSGIALIGLGGVFYFMANVASFQS